MTNSSDNITAQIWSDPNVLIWRTAFGDWVAGGIGAAVFVWYGIYNMLAGIVFLGAVFIVVSMSALALVLARPYCALGAGHLLIQNPLRRYVIPVSDIQELNPRYDGLHVHTQDGRVVVVLCLQKWNIDWMLRRRTRADIAAAAITEARAV